MLFWLVQVSLPESRKEGHGMVEGNSFTVCSLALLAACFVQWPLAV